MDQNNNIEGQHHGHLNPPGSLSHHQSSPSLHQQLLYLRHGPDNNNMDHIHHQHLQPHHQQSAVTLPSLPNNNVSSGTNSSSQGPIPNLPKSHSQSFSPHQSLMQMPIPQMNNNGATNSSMGQLSMSNMLNSSSDNGIKTSLTSHDSYNPNISSSSSSGKFKKSGGLRVRVKKACDRCKRQKIKCDGETPCRVCQKSDHECIYSVAATNTNTNTVTTSPGSSNIGATMKLDSRDDPSFRDNNTIGPVLKNGIVSEAYTAYLENKVRELENQLSKVSQGQIQCSSTSQEKIFHANSYTFSGDKYRVMRRYQNILPHKFGTEISQTVLDLAEINRNKPADEQLVIPRIQFYGWNLSGGHYLKQRKLPEFENLFNLQDKADLSCVHWLLNYFFVKINPLYSVIHKRVFNDQYNSYLNNLSKRDESTRLFSAMLYLILSLTIRFADSMMPLEVKSRISGRLEENLFDSGYEVVSKLSFEWQSYELIQCWILITFYLRVTHRQNSSFMSLGSAIRMMKGMSLNLNIIPERLQKYAYEEIKLRRCFWIVYTWDKIYSFQSGKASELTDEQIFVPLPSLSEPELPDDWLNPLSLAMTHLSIISSEVSKYNQTHSEYDDMFMKNIIEKLYQWKVQTEKNIELSKLQSDSELVNQLELTYYDILLNIHNKTLVQCTNLTSSSALIENSQSVLKIIQSLVDRNELIKPWWLTLTILFNVSLTTLILISNNPQDRLLPILHSSLSFLKLLDSQGNFGMVKECIWCLNTLNYLSILKFENGVKLLKSEIDDDGLTNEVNKIKFYQFGKVKEKSSPKSLTRDTINNNNNNNNTKVNINNGTTENSQQVEIHSRRTSVGSSLRGPLAENGMGIEDLSPSVVDGDPSVDLMGNLKWFDQWLNEFK